MCARLCFSRMTQLIPLRCRKFPSASPATPPPATTTLVYSFASFIPSTVDVAIGASRRYHDSGYGKAANFGYRPLSSVW